MDLFDPEALTSWSRSWITVKYGVLTGKEVDFFSFVCFVSFGVLTWKHITQEKKEFPAAKYTNLLPFC